jgi:hypothetical protein
MQLRRSAAAVLLGCSALLVACGGGGGGNEEDATQVLDEGFNHTIKSADIKIDATLEAKGLQGLDKPIRVQAGGPYVDNGDKFPSFDIDLKVGAGGGGQVINTGRVSTGDRAFVKFEDTYYELPRSIVRQANRSFRGNEKKRGLLRGIGLDARNWVEDAKVEGDEDVDGVSTTHVSGKLDIPRALQDLNRFVQRSGKELGAAAGQVPQPLPRADLDKIAQVVKDPSFDVYVGKEDSTIRRVSAHLELEVPKEDRAAVNGLEGGTIDFSIEFDDVGGNQKIEVPAKARPISDLTKSLGTSVLDGGLPTPTTPQSSGGSSGGSSDGPSPKDFKDYADCLDKAKAQDTEALQRCATLLQP